MHVSWKRFKLYQSHLRTNSNDLRAQLCKQMTSRHHLCLAACVAMTEQDAFKHLVYSLGVIENFERAAVRKVLDHKLRGLIEYLLSNADIEGAVWESGLKAVHASPTAHGCVDAHNPAVLLCLCNKGICKVVGVRARLRSQIWRQFFQLMTCLCF